MKKRPTSSFGAPKIRKTIAAGVAMSVFCTPYLSDLVRVQNLYADVVPVPATTGDEHQDFEDAKYQAKEDLHILAGYTVSDAMSRILNDGDAAIDALSYNDILSYEDNLVQLNSLSGDIAGRIDLQLSIESYDEYRRSIVDSLYNEAGPLTSIAVTTVLHNAETAIDNLLYDPSMSFEDNCRAADALAASIAGDLHTAQDADRFYAYVNSLIDALYNEAGPAPSDSVSLIVHNGETALQNLLYDPSMSYADNCRAADALASSIASDLHVGQDAVSFYSYVNSLIDDLYREAGPVTSDRVSRVVHNGESALQSLIYDPSMSLVDNCHAADALASSIAGDLHTAQDADSFYAYVNSLIDDLYNEAGPVTSDRVSRVVHNGETALQNLLFDPSMSFEGNRRVADALASSIAADLHIAQDADSFYAYVNSLIDDLYNEVGSGPSQGVSDIMHEGETALQNLLFDPAMSLYDNCRAADDLAGDIAGRIHTRQDYERFEDNKTSLLTRLSGVLGTNPSAEEQALFDMIEEAVTNFPYNPELSYDDNITAFNNMVSGLQNGQEPEEQEPDYEAAFEAEKTSMMEYIASCAGATPSSEVIAILTDGQRALDNLSYDPALSYETNLSGANDLANMILGTLNDQLSAERFEANKATMMSYIASCAGATPSSEVITILEDGQAAFDNLSYNPAVSYESNIRGANDLGRMILGMLNDQLCIERFNAEKETIMNGIASLAGDAPSSAMIGILEDGSAALDNFGYNVGMSYETNIAGLTDLARQIEGAVRLQLSIEAFEDYKDTLMNEIAALAGNAPSPEVIEILENGSMAMDAFDYNESLSFESNAAAAENLAQMIASTVLQQMNVEKFEADKQSLIDRLGSVVAGTTDAGEIALYEDLCAAINSYEYDVTHSYEANWNGFLAYVAGLQASLEENESRYEAVNVEDFPSLTLPVYNILDGEGTTWESDSVSADEGLTFRCEQDIADFSGIAVDGNIVAQSNYTTAQGSTYCTLSQEYLQTLAEGNHRLVFIYSSGISAPVNFSVKASTDEQQNAAPVTAQGSAAVINPATPAAVASAPSVADSISDESPAVDPSTVTVPAAQAPATVAAAAPTAAPAAQAASDTAVAAAPTAAPAAATAAPAASGASTSAAPATGEASVSMTDIYGFLLLGAAVVLFGTVVKKAYVQR